MTIDYFVFELRLGSCVVAPCMHTRHLLKNTSTDNSRYFCDEATELTNKRIEDLPAVTTDLRDRLERAEAEHSRSLKLKIEEISQKRR